MRGVVQQEGLDSRQSAASDVSDSAKAPLATKASSGAEAAKKAQEEAWDAQARKKAVRSAGLSCKLSESPGWRGGAPVTHACLALGWEMKM